MNNKDVTRLMIKVFKLKELGYDFMGYDFLDVKDLSFHHLIVARKDCTLLGIGDGYVFWNGAILARKTSHEYLHLVERLDRDRFNYISGLLIDENVRNQIVYANLVKISECLDGFEQEYSGKHNPDNNKVYIKKEYTRRRYKR